MRGEDAGELNGSARVDGSPPHAWGRLGHQQPIRDSQRFTPTCVGKTLDRLEYPRLAEVHPHMRGEDAAADLASRARAGSPPHAWGRLFLS